METQLTTPISSTAPRKGFAFGFPEPPNHLGTSPFYRPAVNANFDPSKFYSVNESDLVSSNPSELLDLPSDHLKLSSLGQQEVVGTHKPSRRLPEVSGGSYPPQNALGPHDGVDARGHSAHRGANLARAKEMLATPSASWMNSAIMNGGDQERMGGRDSAPMGGGGRDDRVSSSDGISDRSAAILSAEEVGDGRRVKAGTKRERSGKKSKAKRTKHAKTGSKSSSSVDQPPKLHPVGGPGPGTRAVSSTAAPGPGPGPGGHSLPNSNQQPITSLHSMMESPIDSSRTNQLVNNVGGYPRISSTSSVSTPFQSGFGTAQVSNSDNPLPTLQFHRNTEPARSSLTSLETPTHSLAAPPNSVALPTLAGGPAHLEFGHVRVKREPGLAEPETKEPHPSKVFILINAQHCVVAIDAHHKHSNMYHFKLASESREYLDERPLIW